MTIKELKSKYKLTQKQLNDISGIPLRTIENWESGASKPKEYILNLLENYLEIKLKGAK